jgi:group I intron endonuclease
MYEVYKIENKLNNKIYIGITIQGARTRFLHHLYESRSGSSFPIHRSINKYGKENFTIDTIEVCDSAEQMKEREKFWISFYNTTDRSIGYNRTIGGDGTFGRLHSDETKEKIRRKALGRRASKEIRARMSESHKLNPISKENIERVILMNKNRVKPVIQYDINMNKLAEFDSIKSAYEITGVNRATICGIIKRGVRTDIRRGPAPKFIWKLKE